MTKKKVTVIPKVEPVKKEKKKPTIVTPETVRATTTRPMVIETIRSTEKISEPPVFEKREYKSIPIPIEAGNVRVIVLKDYKGMLNDLYEGDIVDMPERRYKSLAFRGMVKLYEGEKLPNKQR